MIYELLANIADIDWGALGTLIASAYAFVVTWAGGKSEKGRQEAERKAKQLEQREQELTAQIATLAGETEKLLRIQGEYRRLTKRWKEEHTQDAALAAEKERRYLALFEEAVMLREKVAAYKKRLGENGNGNGSKL